MKTRVPLTILLLVPLCVSAGELIVFPAVTDEAPGLNNSLWVTDAQIIKMDPRDEVVVTRKWVCLQDGGFLDAPGEAPQHRLSPNTHCGRILQLWGDELLGRTGGASQGAVAYEVEGGDVIAHSRVVDVLRGYYNERKAAFGQGQLIPAFKQALEGPSHISWLGGCSNRPCSEDPPTRWNYLRNNIGLVNPNPEPLIVRFVAIPFGRTSGPECEYRDPEPEEFTKEVPPYGWLQFRWTATHDYGSDNFDDPYIPWSGFIVSLVPEQDQPYYAYASMVFTPDPDSGVPEFNDPMYVPAEPGYFAPIAEVIPPR